MRVRSLHARLAAALLVLLLIVGTAMLLSSLVATRLYMNEVIQTLNLGLAYNIAKLKSDALLGENGELREEGVEQLLHWMMVVNPGPNFYVLNLRGDVIAYDPGAGDPADTQVSLAPIREFLDVGLHRSGPERPAARRAILGSDPRDPSAPKIFSVSPLPIEGPPRGYLYVVLDSQPFGSVAEDLRHSYVLRLSVGHGLAYLAVVLAVGWVAFRWLTRPLGRLVRRMEALGLDGEGSGQWDAPDSGDEVDRLERTFDAMAQRIRGQMEEIERTAELRRELIANVSHDLRTPIATLRGYLETLSLKEGVLTGEQRDEYLAIALRQSERLGRLVTELFELTKLDRQEVEPQLERFRVGELVQDNVQRFRLHAQAGDIHLEADFARDLPPVYADIPLIERALENLIENALRHTEKGGSVTVALREVGARLEVSVIDTGHGISEDDLPHIFDRYYQASRSGKGSKDGAGLGLAITRRIVELHGSELVARSELGEGTTFSFSLPVAPRTQLSGLANLTGPGDLRDGIVMPP
ncbi:MAG: HAMP domain-containing sensor histidine kinase [Acidobacteriota bacterium]